MYGPTEARPYVFIDAARLAEDVVGHPLAGKLMRGGSLRELRRKLAGAAD